MPVEHERGHDGETPLFDRAHAEERNPARELEADLIAELEADYNWSFYCNGC